LGEPSYASILCSVKIGFCDQLVERGGLVKSVFVIEITRLSKMSEVVFFLYSSADCAKSFAG
jgi:hypothetical protein